MIRWPCLRALQRTNKPLLSSSNRRLAPHFKDHHESTRLRPGLHRLFAWWLSTDQQRRAIDSRRVAKCFGASFNAIPRPYSARAINSHGRNPSARFATDSFTLIGDGIRRTMWSLSGWRGVLPRGHLRDAKLVDCHQAIARRFVPSQRLGSGPSVCPEGIWRWGRGFGERKSRGLETRDRKAARRLVRDSRGMRNSRRIGRGHHPGRRCVYFAEVRENCSLEAIDV